MKRIFTLIAFITFSLSSAFAQAPRTTLLEICESVYTRDVANTICLKEELRSQFGDDLAILSYHPDDFQGPNGTKDPLYTFPADQWWSVFNSPGYGQGFTDRYSFNGTNLVLGRSLWADTIAARLNRTSIALVTLPEVLYDASKEEIFVRVQIDFQKENIELKDFRFFLYVAADSQLSVQRFDTTDLGLCTTFIDPNDTNYFMTDTLYDFYHSDVVIASPSTFSGVDFIIPNDVESGARYWTTFKYTVPNNYNIDHLKVVGFVADFNQSIITSNRVINTAQSATFTTYDSDDSSDPNHPENPSNPNSVFHPDNWATGIDEVMEDVGMTFFPNPMKDVGVLDFTVPRKQHVQVDVYGLDGRWVKNVYSQELMAGNHRAAVSSTGLSRGLYVLRVKGETFVRSTQIAIQ